MGDTFELDQGDRETLRGTLHDPQATVGDVLTVQADKSIAAAPGGGSMPIETDYQGNAVTIADGASALLGWDNIYAGTEDLLDRTDPLNPAVIAAGLYAVWVSVAVFGGITAGGVATVVLNVGQNEPYATPYWVMALYGATPAMQQLAVTVGSAMVLEAGESLSVQVNNEDGAVSRDFFIQVASVVKA